MSYTPMTDDVGYYLKATASYTDGEGAGKSADAMTTSTVTAADPLLVKYDVIDTNGMIDRSEVIAAIRSYLADDIDRTEVIAVIRLYLGTLDS